MTQGTNFQESKPKTGTCVMALIRLVMRTKSIHNNSFGQKNSFFYCGVDLCVQTLAQNWLPLCSNEATVLTKSQVFVWRSTIEIGHGF